MHKIQGLWKLIAGLLVNSTVPIKIIGDKSLSKRDFKRIAIPLSQFGQPLISKIILVYP